MVLISSVNRVKKLQLLLALIVAWAWAWGTWAVLLDVRPSGSDSIFEEALFLAAPSFTWDRIGLWIGDLDHHPPLPYFLAALFVYLLGPTLSAVRLSAVVLHGVAVWQVHGLARAAGGDRSTALWAALLCALTPTIFGWFRLDFQEPLTTVLLLATLRVAITVRLRRSREAVSLGVLLGLGVLCKLSFVLFGLAPALVFLALRLRSLGAAARALLAVVVAVVVCSWWIWLAFDRLLVNLSMSTSVDSGLWVALNIYLTKAPGNLLLFAASAAGLAWASWRRIKQKNKEKTNSYSFDALLILGSAWGVGTALLLLQFDPWGRYILPLAVLGCVPAGWTVRQLIVTTAKRFGLGTLVEIRFPPMRASRRRGDKARGGRNLVVRNRRATPTARMDRRPNGKIISISVLRAEFGLSAACAALLLTHALSLNLASSPSIRDDFCTSGLPNFTWPNEDRRILIDGMVTPDTHLYDAPERAYREARRLVDGDKVLVVLGPADYVVYWWQFYARPNLHAGVPGLWSMSFSEAEELLAQDSPIHVVHVVYPGSAKRAATLWGTVAGRGYQLLQRCCRRRLALLEDHSPIKVAVYEVRRCSAAEHAQQPPLGPPLADVTFKGDLDGIAEEPAVEEPTADR